MHIAPIYFEFKTSLKVMQVIDILFFSGNFIKGILVQSSAKFTQYSSHVFINVNIHFGFVFLFGGCFLFRPKPQSDFTFP